MPDQATLTRLEKSAVDNGFDVTLPRQGDWLGFASTRAPIRLWLSAHAEEGFAAAFSDARVARALGDHGMLLAASLPDGAAAVRSVGDIPALHHLVRRAFQLSRALPNELLHRFEQEIASLPRATEAERLVIARVGQDVFRAGLVEYWDGRCAITGLGVGPLLRASHIHPWKDCATDAERLDVFNGFLLAAHLDAAFDAGFITMDDDGGVLVSPLLALDEREMLGLHRRLRVTRLEDGHRRYLALHRRHVFRAAEAVAEPRLPE